MKKVFLMLIILLFPISVLALEYPSLDSKNVEVYDMTDGIVLYEIKPNEVSSIASLTKIATTITAIEEIDDLDKKIIITDEILKTVSWEASKAGLKVGDELSYRDLLYASMLPSGADATNAIAISSSGSIKNFVEKMNALSKRIGLENTHFVNVTGLDEENHKSTTRDVRKLLVYALKNPTFKKVFTAREYKMTNGVVVKNTFYTFYKDSKINTSKILGNKTGHTDDAGYCLTSLSNVNGHKIIITSLHAKREGNDFYNIIDTAILIDFLSNNYKNRLLIKKGDHIKQVDVKLSNIDSYEIKAPSNVLKYLPSDYDKNDFKIRYDGLEKLSFINIKGKKIGTLNYYYKDRLFRKDDVVLDKNININILKVLANYWYICLIYWFIFASICIITWLIINKKSISNNN